MKRTLSSILLLGILITPLWAKCAPSASDSTSKNGAWRVVTSLKGSSVEVAIGSINDGIQIHSAEGLIENVTWHHVECLVSEDGERIVVWDTYGGIALLDTNCKVLRKATPEEILLDEEQKNRPGKWACHSEGTWLEKEPELTEDALLIHLYSGRTVQWPLGDGLDD